MAIVCLAHLLITKHQPNRNIPQFYIEKQWNLNCSTIGPHLEIQIGRRRRVQTNRKITSYQLQRGFWEHLMVMVVFIMHYSKNLLVILKKTPCYWAQTLQTWNHSMTTLAKLEFPDPQIPWLSSRAWLLPGGTTSKWVKAWKIKRAQQIGWELGSSMLNIWKIKSLFANVTWALHRCGANLEVRWKVPKIPVRFSGTPFQMAGMFFFMAFFFFRGAHF